MKIEDNFLDQKDFDELQTLIISKEFPWYYKDEIDYKGQKGKFMFCHAFYAMAIPYSPSLEKLQSILDIINPISLWRIKVNLLTKTSNIIENVFHIDMKGNMSEEKLKQWVTAIFYVNTNNGYTEFEDGTKVESVANRMLTFPADTKHRGTSCTDEKRRIVINFNYFTQ